MKLLIHILKDNEIEEINLLLKNTPFNINDFMYDETNLFPHFLWKGLLNYQFLVFNIDVLKMEIPRLAKQYEYIKHLEERENYKTLFDTMVEKRILISSFIEYFNDIKDEEKFDLFIKVHQRAEYGFDLITEDFLEKLLKYRHSESPYFPLFNENKVKVYRGVGKLSRDVNMAYSWTLDKEVAEWFANRFDGNGSVYEAYTPSEKIIAYIKSRNEKEVLLLPSYLIDIKKTT